MVPILRADFEYICTFARERTAIVIDPDREHFIESRVAPVAEREGFESIAQLCQAMRLRSDLTNLHMKVIDALTTNETLFFRDVHPFDALRTDILPERIRNSIGRKLQIWSAACSTGQEPYSIAMILKEHFPALGPASVSIEATDLVERVLAQAREGKYSQLEVHRGLPPALLGKYFQNAGSNWTIREELRKSVRFDRMNLIEQWPSLPQFDVILLRNVLIYFNIETRRRILSNIVRQLRPDGYLIMGCAETPLGICSEFQPHAVGRAVVYRLH